MQTLSFRSLFKSFLSFQLVVSQVILAPLPAWGTDESIFRWRSDQVTSAVAADLEEAYTHDRWFHVPWFFDHDLNLRDRIEEVQKETFPEQVSDQLKSSLNGLMTSFTAILYLSRNGYTQSLETEFSVFLVHLVEFNTLLDDVTHTEPGRVLHVIPWSQNYNLTEAGKKAILSRVFQEMDEISSDFFAKEPNTMAKRRVQSSLEHLGGQILSTDFQQELKRLHSRFVGTDSAILPIMGIGIMSTVFILVLGVTGFQELAFHLGFEFGALPFPVQFTGIVFLIAASLIGGFTFSVEVTKRAFSPWHNKMTRVKKKVLECSEVLRKGWRGQGQ